MKKYTCRNCNKSFSPTSRNHKVFCNKKCAVKHNNNNVPYDKSRGYNLKYWFDMNLEDYNKLHQKQNGVCAIYKKPETWFIKRWNKMASLAVDHCHKTNKIRGLLCRRCNQLIGKAEDNIELLQSAIDYLKN